MSDEMQPAVAHSDATQPLVVMRLLDGVPPAFALLAGMQLDIFTALSAGPLPAVQIADALGVGSDGLERLLYALVAAEVLTVDDNCFANTPEANDCLVRGREAYFGHEFLAAMWTWLQQTAETVRTGVPQARHDYFAMSGDELLEFFYSLHPGTLAAGRDLARRFDFSTRQTVLDVAGGSGGLAIALCDAYAHLHVTVVDLPQVTAITERFLREAGVADRVQVVAADAVNETLAGMFSAATMRAFTQVLPPHQIRRVLHNTCNVLMPGGVLYIVTRVVDNSRTAPPETVFSDLIFLNVYDDGRAYTEEQYRDWLTEAGFIDVERIAPPRGDSILVARKPVS
jgi:SAM-dependent methyltransferase